MISVSGLCLCLRDTVFVRPEKFQFLEKGQNRNFDYKKCNFS